MNERFVSGSEARLQTMPTAITAGYGRFNSSHEQEGVGKAV